MASQIGCWCTFDNSLQQLIKISINVPARGALMAKPINETKQLLEGTTSNSYHWVSERQPPKQRARHEVDAFTMLASKVDTYRSTSTYSLLW